MNFSYNNIIKKKCQILLTSTGFANPNIKEKFKKILKKRESAVIITSGSKEKEKNIYNNFVFNQLKFIGFKNVYFVDLENNPNINLINIDLLWVNGGNTFKLLKAMNTSNITKELSKFEGIYVGVSAGSVVLGPNIEIAEIADENEVGLKDFKGLGIINFTIFPHYIKNIGVDKKIKNFEKKYNLVVEKINDNQAIYLKNGLIEKWQ